MSSFIKCKKMNSFIIKVTQFYVNRQPNTTFFLYSSLILTRNRIYDTKYWFGLGGRVSKRHARYFETTMCLVCFKFELNVLELYSSHPFFFLFFPFFWSYLNNLNLNYLQHLPTILLWVVSWACIWELPTTKLPLQIIYNIWLCVKEYYQYCSWIVR